VDERAASATAVGDGDDDADGGRRRQHARTRLAWACGRRGRIAAGGEAAAMAYIAPPLRNALRAGLRRYSEDVLADYDELPEQRQVPGPDPGNQPAVECMRDGVRMAYWHGGIHEVHSQRCDGELDVRFSREVARLGTALPSWFVRTGYAFVRADGDVGALREWVPWVAHCWGRLMCLTPDAVTPPV